MNTNTEIKYASKIQFRNAAAKVFVRINNDSEWFRGKLSIIRCYDINNNSVRFDGKWKALHVGFEFGSISADDHARLMNAGFECITVEVPGEYGTPRMANIYRLPR